MGCLFVFGRMIAHVCFQLGALLAAILMRGVGFVMAAVLGPLCLGSVRELVVTLLRLTRNGRSARSGWQVGSRAVYAVLSGIVWLGAYYVIRFLIALGGWLIGRLASHLAPVQAAWLPAALAAALVFVVGTIMGAQVHRFEDGRGASW